MMVYVCWCYSGTIRYFHPSVFWSISLFFYRCIDVLIYSVYSFVSFCQRATTFQSRAPCALVEEGLDQWLHSGWWRLELRYHRSARRTSVGWEGHGEFCRNWGGSNWYGSMPLGFSETDGQEQEEKWKTRKSPGVSSGPQSNGQQFWASSPSFRPNSAQPGFHNPKLWDAMAVPYVWGAKRQQWPGPWCNSCWSQDSEFHSGKSLENQGPNPSSSERSWFRVCTYSWRSHVAPSRNSARPQLLDGMATWQPSSDGRCLNGAWLRSSNGGPMGCSLVLLARVP